jgi:hypothetical protein
MLKPNLSQSLLKSYLDYYDENVYSCGLAIKKQYFEKIPTAQSDTQKLGVYFEYISTGYCHDMNNPPQPEMVYKGTPKEKLAADYERAHKSAELYQEIIKKHNIEILSYGEYVNYDESSGLFDIRANWNGVECIIDLKYTALFDDKFSDYGWHTESLQYKSKLLLQPIHYKYLMKKTKGVEDMPFYFFIFSSKDPEKVKIIKTTIQEEHLNLHESITVEKMKRYISFHYNNPDELIARPSYLRCKTCSYFDTCDKRAEIPLVEEIYY